jgi:hypothetical protein
MKFRIALVLVLATTCVFARSAKEQARIDYLINSLSDLKSVVFIRNGSDYDASAAQNHLRQKLRFAGERIHTAEQFIKYCASESSMIRKPYQIRFSDGKVENTADYFAAKLREYDQSHP